jgi:UDP-glucose 4-epimerase
MPRRVLVTGGAGFIGSHLVEVLVSAGDEVAVLDDLSRGRRAWLRPEAELHELDIRDGRALRRTVARLAPEVVVHLAAMHFIPAVENAPELARDVNVIGTESLLEALAPRPPGLLLFASSAAVYADRRGPIDESCVADPIDLYGRTKLEAERLVTTFAARSGTRAIIARIFNVIGKRETNRHIVPELVEQLRDGAASLRVGNLSPRRDYTDVRDVADALRRLLVSSEDRGVLFNVGSGRSASVAELVQLCEQILDRRIQIEVDERRLRAQDRAELVADPHLLREGTGWQPVRSLRETLAELLTGREEFTPSPPAG